LLEELEDALARVGGDARARVAHVDADGVGVRDVRRDDDLAGAPWNLSAFVSRFCRMTRSFALSASTCGRPPR
jgi:hypothetical protein